MLCFGVACPRPIRWHCCSVYWRWGLRSRGGPTYYSTDLCWRLSNRYLSVMDLWGHCFEAPYLSGIPHSIIKILPSTSPLAGHVTSQALTWIVPIGCSSVQHHHGRTSSRSAPWALPSVGWYTARQHEADRAAACSGCKRGQRCVLFTIVASLVARSSYSIGVALATCIGSLAVSCSIVGRSLSAQFIDFIIGYNYYDFDQWRNRPYY